MSWAIKDNWICSNLKFWYILLIKPIKVWYNNSEVVQRLTPSCIPFRVVLSFLHGPLLKKHSVLPWQQLGLTFLTFLNSLTGTYFHVNLSGGFKIFHYPLCLILTENCSELQFQQPEATRYIAKLPRLIMDSTNTRVEETHQENKSCSYVSSKTQLSVFVWVFQRIALKCSISHWLLQLL